MSATAGSGRRLYVYYRVALPDLAPTLATVRAMQLKLQRTHPGLNAELLRRPTELDGAAAQGQATLMEIYASMEGVDAHLMRAIESAASGMAIRPTSSRSLEFFEKI